MPRAVHVEPIEVALPAGAGRRCAAVALASCGQARPTLLLVVGLDRRPGLTVAPWTLDGIVDTAAELGLNLRCDRIGPADPRDPIGRRLHRRGLAPQRTREAVGLRVPGTRRAVAVPRDWVGVHVCLVVPCIHRSSSHQGPASAALAGLTSACTRESVREASAVGRWLATHVFASASIVVDASWGATLGPRHAPHLVASQCVFAAQPLDAALVDAAIRRHVPGARPGVPLAGRSLEGLGVRRVARSARAGDMHIPGPLARAWHAYPDHAIEPSR